MFTQQKLLFQFTKAIALVILFCFTFSYQAQGEKAVKEKAKGVAVITAQPEYDYEAEFKEEIETRLAALKEEFEKPEPGFGEMADLLGDNAILTTPQGDRLKGTDSLGKFWREEKRGGVTNVDFAIRRRYAIKVAKPIEQGKNTIEHIGYAIIDYDLITNEDGTTLTNHTGILTLSLRHPRMCTWE